MAIQTKTKSVLIIIIGLVGTGKTTLAQTLAKRLGVVVISSDVIRKIIAGVLASEHRFEGFNQGIYSTGFTANTYAVMFADAKEILLKGNSVILDASFPKMVQRTLARKLAKDVSTGFLAVECVLDEVIIKERLANRRDTASDGRWEIYLEQKKVFEPVVEISPEEHIVVDTSKPVEVNVRRILEFLG